MEEKDNKPLDNFQKVKGHHGEDVKKKD